MQNASARKRMIWIVVIGFILFIISSAALLWGGIWLEKKLMLVRRGDAKPYFPFAEYKEEELRALMPFAFHDAIDRVPTRTPPEETLRVFIEAMKKGDIDTAVKQFVEKDRGGWKTDLMEIKKSGMVDEMVRDLGTAKKKWGGDSVAQFDYFGFNEKEQVSRSVFFQKDTNGDWKIKNL